MSRDKRIRGVVRVAMHGTALDLATSPDAVQEAISRHFILLGETASQYGGTVEHLSGNERLFLFMEAPKTLGAAGALQSAAVRITAMSMDTEPRLTCKFAADFGETRTDERLHFGKARTFSAGPVIENLAAMIEAVPTGQVWATQSLVDEAEKFGQHCRIQSVEPIGILKPVQVVSFLSDVAGAGASTRSLRKSSTDRRGRSLSMKWPIRLALIMAIVFGGWTWANRNPKLIAQWKKQVVAVFSPKPSKPTAKKGAVASSKKRITESGKKLTAAAKPKSTAKSEPGTSEPVLESTTRTNRLERKLPSADENEEQLVDPNSMDAEVTEPEPTSGVGDQPVDPSEPPP